MRTKVIVSDTFNNILGDLCEVIGRGNLYQSLMQKWKRHKKKGRENLKFEIGESQYILSERTVNKI